MTYDAKQIANWFVTKAQEESRPLTIMQLLKLVYISHGWHLEISKKPLFHNKIQAWQFGPVVPDVYHAYRKQGVEIKETLSLPTGDLSDNQESLLTQIWDIYGEMSGSRLSEITHETGGPWDLATKMNGHFAPIPNELIQKHYEMKRLQSKQVQ